VKLHYRLYVTRILENIAKTAGNINAMIHHDITRNYGGSMENTARVISTEGLIIVAEKDYLIYPAPSIDKIMYIAYILT
jgi:hypothetical protein